MCESVWHYMRKQVWLISQMASDAHVHKHMYTAEPVVSPLTKWPTVGFKCLLLTVNVSLPTLIWSESVVFIGTTVGINAVCMC